MKSRLLALIMGLLVAVAPAAALACRCVFGDCGGERASTAVSSSTQCHHGAPHSDQQRSSEECCGKCRIERAELVSKKISGEPTVRTVQGDLSLRQAHLSGFLCGRHFQDSVFRDGIPDFFTDFVFSATFAFRGPPVG